MKVVTGEVMREIDRRTIEEVGIPGIVLMEHAGYLSAEIIYKYLQDTGARRVGIIAGKGNNGGDGLVLARHLFHQGIEVEVILTFAPGEATGDAAVNLKIVKNLGIPLQTWDDLIASRGPAALEEYDLLVDGLLGTGIKGEVRGRAREIIEALNVLPRPVVSLDIPSGIDASTGRVMGTAVQAEMTVTFGLPKVGNVTQPGSEYNGSLHVVDIGIPGQLVLEAPDDYRLITGDTFQSGIFYRNPNSHKGNYGRVYVLAGSRGMTGAAVLSSHAALKAGAGLVYLGVPASLYPIFANNPVEVIALPYEDQGSGILTDSGEEEIRQDLENKDIVVIGPGLGRHLRTRKFVNHLITTIKAPLILDADGINCLQGPEALAERNQLTIITPHPGELAGLLGMETGQIQENRIQLARDTAVTYGIWVVLKGSRTVIAGPDGKVSINSTGNPGMATAGSGDVLTGIIGGFLTALNSLSIRDRLCLAVYIHGLAGDLAAQELGETSLMAKDILKAIPGAISQLERRRG